MSGTGSSERRSLTLALLKQAQKKSSKGMVCGGGARQTSLDRGESLPRHPHGSGAEPEPGRAQCGQQRREEQEAAAEAGQHSNPAPLFSWSRTGLDAIENSPKIASFKQLQAFLPACELLPFAGAGKGRGVTRTPERQEGHFACQRHV